MTKFEQREFLSNNQEFWPEGLTFSKLRVMKHEELFYVYKTVVDTKVNYNRIAEYTRIEPPTFEINGNILNEYELRQLMVDVKNGKFESGYFVKDCKGNIAYIESNGMLSKDLYGLDLITNSTINLLRG